MSGNTQRPHGAGVLSANRRNPAKEGCMVRVLVASKHRACMDGGHGACGSGTTSSWVAQELAGPPQVQPVDPGVAVFFLGETAKKKKRPLRGTQNKTHRKRKVPWETHGNGKPGHGNTPTDGAWWTPRVDRHPRKTDGSKGENCRKIHPGVWLRGGWQVEGSTTNHKPRRRAQLDPATDSDGRVRPRARPGGGGGSHGGAARSKKKRQERRCVQTSRPRLNLTRSLQQGNSR